jgi:hypothetical protein
MYLFKVFHTVNNLTYQVSIINIILDIAIINITQAMVKVSSADVDWLRVSNFIPTFKLSSLAKSVVPMPMALLGRRHMAAFALLRSEWLTRGCYLQQ